MYKWLRLDEESFVEAWRAWRNGRGPLHNPIKEVMEALSSIYPPTGEPLINYLVRGALATSEELPSSVSASTELASDASTAVHDYRFKVQDSMEDAEIDRRELQDDTIKFWLLRANADAESSGDTDLGADAEVAENSLVSPSKSLRNKRGGLQFNSACFHRILQQSGFSSEDSIVAAMRSMTTESSN